MSKNRKMNKKYTMNKIMFQKKVNIFFLNKCFISFFYILFEINADPKCSVRKYNSRHELSCSDFQEFSEINFTNYKSNFNFIELINVNPNKALILDDTFQWTGFNLSTKRSQINFINLSGIQLNSLETVFRTFGRKVGRIFFLRSKLEFYVKESKVTDCHEINQSLKLFQNVEDLLSFFVKYSKITCTDLFKNLTVKSISFSLLKNSLITRNLLNFVDSNRPNMEHGIKELILSSYDIEINTKIINYQIFKNIEKIEFNFNIKFIETSTFLFFKNLKIIKFSLINSHEMLYRNSKWLNNLNTEVEQINYFDNLTPESMSLIMRQRLEIIFTTSFELFDQDLCLFSEILHHRLIFFYTNPINCSSCTNIWITMNSLKLNFIYQSKQSFILDYKPQNRWFMNECFLNQSDYEEKIQKCEFNSRFKNCINPTINIYDVDEELNDLNNLQESFNLFFLVSKFFLSQILLIGALIINLLVLKVLRLKPENKQLILEQKMYSYLKFNIGFNIAIIVRSLLSLMSDCIENNSIFCSEIRTSSFVQYFYIYIVNYFGSVLRFCSNMSLLFFSMDRYFFNKIKKNRFIDYFNKIELKVFLKFILLTSCIFNVSKIFKYHVVEEKHESSYLYDPSPSYYESYPDVKRFFDQSLDLWVSVSDVLIELFNDVIIFFLNLLIDILLLRKVKKILTQKKNLLYKSFAIKSQRNLYLMIIFNSLLNLMFRIPDLLASVCSLLDIYFKNYQTFTYSPFPFFKYMRLLNQICESSSTLSYYVNFIILYKFNLKFKKCLHSLFKKKNT